VILFCLRSSASTPLFVEHQGFSNPMNSLTLSAVFGHYPITYYLSASLATCRLPPICPLSEAAKQISTAPVHELYVAVKVVYGEGNAVRIPPISGSRHISAYPLPYNIKGLGSS